MGSSDKFESRTLKIAIVAGEASGDMLGAALMQSLLGLHPDLKFEGMGGPLMEEVGLHSLYPMETLSVMGFIEPLKRLPELLKVRLGLVDYLAGSKPDVFIGIDSPDFNLGVEKSLRNRGVPTVHYVSPSVWAWRQGRVKSIRNAVDLVLCLLPFEADFYRREGVPATYVGHPMADEIDIVQDRRAHRQSLNLPNIPGDSQLVAILPGSRMSEIDKIAPVFFATADKLVRSHKNRVFLVPAASEKVRSRLVSLAADRPYLHIMDGRARRVLGASEAALVASGTATLEALLMKCPMVVAYRVDRLTYWIGKMLVKTNYLALANLIAGRGLVKERIQSAATVETLFEDMEHLLARDQKRENLIDEFGKLHGSLRLDASRTAANAVLNLIKSRPVKNPP